MPTPRQVQRTYLLLLLGNTLAAITVFVCASLVGAIGIAEENLDPWLMQLGVSRELTVT